MSQALSVRATEEAARDSIRGEKTSNSSAGTSTGKPTRPEKGSSTQANQALDPDTRAYLERLERRLQTRVALHPAAGGGGKLEIHYFNLEDLERIGGLLLGQS